jgi:soluble lytic murein transglycosylase-like protein
MNRSITLLLAKLALVLSSQEADAFCFREAALRYGVSEVLLQAIARAESAMNPTALNRNADGTEDIGLMQIHSSLLPILARYGIDRQRLLDDPCVNVNIGAWVLADNIRRYGPTWKTVGAYNAMSSHKQQSYVSKVWRQLTR